MKQVIKMKAKDETTGVRVEVECRITTEQGMFLRREVKRIKDGLMDELHDVFRRRGYHESQIHFIGRKV